MKNLILIIASSFCFFNSIVSQPAAVVELVQNYVQSLPENAEIAIGYIQNGEMTTMGYHHKNGEIVAVDNQEDIFEIGSMTKTYTAYLLAEQVANGEMEMGDPISQYLGDSAIPSTIADSVTLHQLVTHTSGLAASPSTYIFPFLKSKLGHSDNPYKFIQWKHFAKYLRKGTLENRPGEQWTYNNSAIALLGYLIAQQQTTTWEDLLQSNIFNRYGMHNSYPTGIDVPEKLFVQGYDVKGKPANYWDMDFINPAGSIKSCVTDQLKWLNLHLQPTTDSVFTILKTMTDIDAHWKGTKMGHGWIHKLTDDKHITWHGGATGAFKSFSAFNEEDQTAVVILTNFNHAHPQMRDKNGKSRTRACGFALLNVLSAAKQTLSKTD